MDTLELERLHALITNLNADTANLVTEGRKLQAEQEKLRSEDKKLQAESLKLKTESRWYPVAVAAGLLGAGAAAGAALGKLFS